LRRPVLYDVNLTIRSPHLNAENLRDVDGGIVNILKADEAEALLCEFFGHRLHCLIEGLRDYPS